MSQLLDEQAQRHPRRPALVAGDRTLTYPQWAAAAAQVAAGLQQLGVRRGDRVGLLCSNRLEWLLVAFGALRLGASVAAYNTWSRAWDLAYQLEHSGAHTFVLLGRFRSRDYGAELCELLPQLAAADPGGWRSARFPELRHVVVIGDSAPRGALTLQQLLAAGGSAGPLPTAPGNAASAADVAFLLYTSGSTARPKGVPLQHYALVENGFNIGERVGVRPTDRVWVSVPLFWSYGSANALMATMTHGATMVLQESFEPGEALALIERQRCTVAYTLPNITHALVQHPAFTHARTASLRTGLTIGGPEELRLAAHRLGIRRICSIYGSTETYGNCCVTPHTDPDAIRFTTQGPPLPGVELRIVDPATGDPVPPGEVGEVWVRGYVMPGYLGAPAENARAFTPDGFFRTGDLGRIEANGRFAFQARASEMIKTGGINVSPLEVEDFLSTHPAIAQVAVVGVAHAVKGQVVVAFVRLHPGAQVSTAELRDWCKRSIADFKIPELFEFLDEFPTTDTGKLSRLRLRELGAEAWQRRQTEGRGA